MVIASATHVSHLLLDAVTAPISAGIAAVKLWPFAVTLTAAVALQALSWATTVGILAQEVAPTGTTAAVIQTGSLATVLGTLVLFAQQIFSGKLIHRDVATATAELAKALDRATAAADRANQLHTKSLEREARLLDLTDRLINAAQRSDPR